MHHRHAVAGELHIQFRAIATAPDHIGKCRQRVLRHQGRAAAMGDVPGLHVFL